MTALYIHIPFCKKKCHYCDFVSYAGKEDEIDDYVDKIVNEIINSSLVIRHLPAGKAGSPLKTIYFGGGTPTLLSPKHFDKIISTLISHSSLDISHLEVSIEANPGTANKAKLKALRQLGINRLSIGAQSFNNHHLKVLGRIHSAEEVFRFYDDARSVGFDNINLDLIFALPNQTLEEWKKDLQTALHLSPPHLSIYNLELHEGSPLRSELSDEEELAMYEHTIETLTAAGFKHYEISNFAKPGYECQHNINYWKMGDWIGIGEGAKSRPSEDQRNTIFMGLRMLEGLPAEKFHGFEKEVAELIEDGLLMRENNRYKLTRRGLYLGNLVFERFV